MFKFTSYLVDDDDFIFNCNITLQARNIGIATEDEY
jgi:hypothetical protein